MSSDETLIFFGIDGIYLADSIKKKIMEKKEAERRIAEKILRLEAIANSRVNSPIGKKAPEGQGVNA